MIDPQVRQVIVDLGLRLPELAPGELIDISVAYVRVSSRGQLGTDEDIDDDGYSIPAQVQQSERKSSDLKLHLAKVYMERAESAKSDDRPALQKMLTELPVIKALPMVRRMTLIVPKVDRLARNRLDDALLCQQLITWGIDLASATEHIDKTPSGKMMHGMLAVMSEYYSNNLAEEVMKGLRRKHESGGTPKRPPIGYLSKRELIGGRDIRWVIVDPERSRLVKLAFTLYATGEWPLRRLTQHLADQGLRSRGTPHFPSKPLSLSRVHNMLRDPYYMGIVVWNGKRYPGKHEPLIDPETFDKVQALLAAARVSGERPQRHAHYLRGSVVCDTCHGRLLFGRHRSRSGDHYEYFCCNNRTVRRRPIQCSSSHYSVAATEKNVIQVVYPTVYLPAEVTEQIRTELRQDLADRTAVIQQEAERHERRIAQIEAKQSKLLQLFYDDRISENVFAAEQDKLKAETEAATHLRGIAIAEVEDVEAALEIALERIDDAERNYREGTALERRLLNRAIFEYIEIGPEAEVTGTKLTPVYEALSAWQPTLGKPKTGEKATKALKGQGLGEVRLPFSNIHHPPAVHS